MSSSRVIKSGSKARHPVAEFCFNSLQEKAAHPLSVGGNGFLPFYHDEAPLHPLEEMAEPVFEAPPVHEEYEARGMVQMAEEELQRRLQEAFEKGIEAERRQADEDLAGICSALAEAISVVSRLRARLIRESEEQLLKLSFLVAKKVIRQEIKQDRQILGRLVSEALRGFPEQHDIIVSLHPDDYKIMSANRELFLADIGEERQITFKPDEATTLGGCIVESATGVIDARIEAQLDEIYKGLVEDKSRLSEFATTMAMPEEPGGEATYDGP